MSLHGSLAGQSWSHFHGISGTSTPSHSPRPPSSSSPGSRRSYSCSEDVMKLPSRDMAIFGICPSQDDFLLVICENCGQRVKLEAFESHNVARHGSQRQKDARKAMLNDKASALDLIKEDIFNNAPPPPMVIGGGASSSNCSSSSSSSSSCTSENIPPVRIKKPMKVEETLQPPPPPPPPMEVVVQEVLEEGPDSSLSSSSNNNVISIPDNESLPPGMSKDLMELVEESSGAGVSLVLPPPPPAPVIAAAPSANSSHLLPQQHKQPPNTSTQEVVHKPSPSKKPRSERRQNSRDREYHPDKHCGVWDNDSKKHCTRALTCKSHSVLLKRKILGRSKSFDELVVEHKAVKEAAALAARAAAVSPVVLSSELQPVTIPMAAAATAVTTTPVVHNGVLPSRISAPVVPPPSLPPPPITTTTTAAPLPTPVSPVHSPPSEENLFYTTDHPKPLAVCSFGGRRFAHTLTTKRSDIFTRKVLRLAAYSSGTSQGFLPTNRYNGFRVMKTTQQGSLPRSSPLSAESSPLLSGGGGAGNNGFLVNYNLSNHLGGVPSSNPTSGSGGTVNHVKLTPAPQGTAVTLGAGGIKLSSLSQQNILLQEGFKASDFSGIQFEFGK